LASRTKSHANSLLIRTILIQTVVAHLKIKYSILILFFTQSIAAQVEQYSNKYDVPSFVEHLSENNINNYFKLRFYERGVNKYYVIPDGSCKGKGTKDKIFIFWKEEGIYYLKKFDDCSSYKKIKISPFAINFALENHDTIIDEFVLEYKSPIKDLSTNEFIDLLHLSAIGRIYTFYFDSNKTTKHLDLYDFSNPKDFPNSNFNQNNRLKIYFLSEYCEDLIFNLENDNKFIPK